MPPTSRRARYSIQSAIVAMAVLLAFVLVFPTMRYYLIQRQELQDLRSQVSQTQTQNQKLQDELDRWNDPAYVEAQARQRLQYVLPGESAYRVVDPERATGSESDSQAADNPHADAGGADPWYDQIWKSVEQAGQGSTP